MTQKDRGSDYSLSDVEPLIKWIMGLGASYSLMSKERAFQTKVWPQI